MIWVGNLFYPGTGTDWNLPREIVNPPAYAFTSDKAQYILESTGLEGYGRAPLGWRRFRRPGLRGPYRGYGQVEMRAAMGTPAHLTCRRTPNGFIRCEPRYSYSWDEYANRIEL